MYRLLLLAAHAADPAEAPAEPAPPAEPMKLLADPAGRFSAMVPEKWPVDIRPTNGFSFIVAGDQFAQCQFVATPRPSTASTRPDMMQEATSQPISDQAWQAVMGAMDGLFSGQGAVISHSVDTTKYWPIQRALLHAPFGPLQGAIQFRPGLEIWTFCTTPGNIEAGARFEPVIQSVTTANDASLEADAERLKAADDAEYARIQAQHEAALAEIHRQQAEAEARQAQRNRHRRRDDNNN